VDSLSKTKALNRYKSKVKDKDRAKDRVKVTKAIKNTTKTLKVQLEQSTMPRRNRIQPLT
jgi:hypothetical protein